jgi:Phytanoyl-CoA dioxygenase (PhyH)
VTAAKIEPGRGPFEEHRGFLANGYVVAPLFAPQEVTPLRDAIAEHMRRLSAALLLPPESSAPEAPYDRRIEQLAVEHPAYAQLLATAVATDAHLAPAAVRLARESRLHEYAERLLGAPVHGQTVRFRGNSSVLSARRHAWHSDVAVVDGTPCGSVRIAAWIPLVDAGPDSGGLEIAPGLRSEPLPHDATPGRFEIPEARLANAPKDRPLVPLGSCLFLDRFTPHRALRNTSGRTRWSLVVWMRAGETDVAGCRG